MAYDLALRDYKPKELGIVRLEKVKCGKPNCRCARGKKHKAYYLYYRDYDETLKRVLKKEYVPRQEVKQRKRKIQLMKNEEHLARLFDNEDYRLVAKVWQTIKDLPRSKMIEKFHTAFNRAKKELKNQDSTLDIRV